MKKGYGPYVGQHRSGPTRSGLIGVTTQVHAVYDARVGDNSINIDLRSTPEIRARLQAWLDAGEHEGFLRLAVTNQPEARDRVILRVWS
jgi:hypothetical protein